MSSARDVRQRCRSRWGDVHLELLPSARLALREPPAPQGNDRQDRRHEERERQREERQGEEQDESGQGEGEQREHQDAESAEQVKDLLEHLAGGGAVVAW